MFSDPKKNLDQFDLSPGMKVADFGSGAGYYTFLAAQQVGETGRVYALDIQKDLLVTLKREADKSGLPNVEAVWADFDQLEGTHLRDASVDRGLVANVIFQVSNRENFVAEIVRVMKPGGKVLVVDWADSFGGIGPVQDTIFPAEKCQELFEKNGLATEKKITAGLHHYGFVFKKK